MAVAATRTAAELAGQHLLPTILLTLVCPLTAVMLGPPSSLALLTHSGLLQPAVQGWGEAALAVAVLAAAVAA